MKKLLMLVLTAIMVVSCSFLNVSAAPIGSTQTYNVTLKIAGTNNSGTTGRDFGFTFYGTWDPNVFAVTTTLTPIVEELLKAIPIIYFGFVISDKRADLLTVSMALGIGFAILENCCILVANLDQTSIIWAFTRGFSSALLHGICTSLVGFGVSYVKKRKKLFYTGTFALLTVAIIVHGLFNAFIQSRYAYIGVILPIAIYIPFVIIPFVKQKTPPKVK